MFSEWSLDSSMGSLVVVLFMIGIITGFATFLYMLLAWILGEERAETDRLHVSELRNEPPFRAAA